MKSKISQKRGLEFYQNLAKAFYVIAASDGTVRKQEFEKLKEIVKTSWLEIDAIEDEFGADAAFQIEIVFDWLKAEELSIQDCFNDFKEFKTNNAQLFTKPVKKLIWKTCDTIASSFYGLNKRELEILYKVKNVLGKP